MSYDLILTLESELIFPLILCAVSAITVCALFIWAGVEWYASVQGGLISPLVFAVLFPLASVLIPIPISKAFLTLLYDLGIPDRYGAEVTQAIFGGTILVLGTVWLSRRIRRDSRSG